MNFKCLNDLILRNELNYVKHIINVSISFFYIRISGKRHIKYRNLEICAINKKKIYIVLSLSLFNLCKSINANYYLTNDAIWIFGGHLGFTMGT